MFAAALGALALSAIPMLVLCLGDPKRRRTVGDKGSGMASSQRRLLAAAACAPGLICVILGNAAAFLMWLGGAALIGWAIAAFFRDPVGAGRPGIQNVQPKSFRR